MLGCEKSKKNGFSHDSIYTKKLTAAVGELVGELDGA